MKKNYLFCIVLSLAMCCSFFTSCKNASSNQMDDDITNVVFNDVDWDDDLSWFVGKWETVKVISQGTDITNYEIQEIEFSSEKVFVKWTSTISGPIIPANTSFEDVKDIIKSNFNIQVNEDKTKLKHTVSGGSNSSYYYFIKK